MTANQVWPDSSSFPIGTNNPTRFQLIFPTLPFLEMFCNRVNLPGISLGMATQSTRIADLKQPGEKLYYDILQVEFLFDNQMKNWKHVHDWMKRISVQGLHASDAVPVRLVTNTGTFVFENVFPIALGQALYDAAVTDIETPSCPIQFAYDRYYPE